MTNHSTMPQLGAGTFRLTGDEAYESVKMALEEGYRHIDTAQIYDNEDAVGKAIADSGIAREELFITTKVWNDNLSERALLDSVKQSLKKLQLEYVDLLLVHWPAPPDNAPMETYLGEMAKAKAQGLTRNIGVSNFTIAHLRDAIEILGADEIYTNQIEVHPYLTNEKVRQFAAQEGIHITAYMPFAVGKVLKDKTICNIASETGASAAQVVVAWQLAHGMATIPSSTKRTNLQDNLKGCQHSLSADEIATIDQLNCGDRQATPDFAPQWDE